MVCNARYCMDLNNCKDEFTVCATATLTPQCTVSAYCNDLTAGVIIHLGVTRSKCQCQ